MLVDTTPERVIVTRNGQTFVGYTKSTCYKDVLDKRGIPTGQRGDFICLMVETDSGTILPCSNSNLQPATEDDVDAIRDREAKAKAELRPDGALWQGGGKVVYTQ